MKDVDVAARDRASVKLAQLKSQFAAAEREIEALNSEEAGHSFAAFSGEAGGKDRLAAWEKRRDDAVTLHRRIGLAVKQAAIAVSVAEERITAQREIAAHAAKVAIAKKIAGHAARMDALLAEFATEFGAWKGEVVKAGIYGIASIEASKRAIQTALMPIDMHSMPLPFAHRHTFTDLSGHWTGSVERAAKAATVAAHAVLNRREEAA